MNAPASGESPKGTDGDSLILLDSGGTGRVDRAKSIWRFSYHYLFHCQSTVPYNAVQILLAMLAVARLQVLAKAREAPRLRQKFLLLRQISKPVYVFDLCIQQNAELSGPD